MKGTRRFRELLKQPGIIRSLGAHDVFTARLIEAAGLETVFLGGFGTAASLLGGPPLCEKMVGKGLGLMPQTLFAFGAADLDGRS